MDGTIRRDLDGINLELNQTEHIGVFGRNGAGKTTLARIITGLDSPTTGRVRFLGGRARVMHVLQRSEDHFSQDTLIQEIGGYLRRRGDLRLAWPYMDAVNLRRELEWVSPRNLSGGHRRLAALACALATEPDLLVIDEPMAGLDAESRAVVRASLGKLHDEAGVGLLIISHHPDDLIGLVERLWVIENGKLLYDGEFWKCPLSALRHCLDDSDVSLYRWLREHDPGGLLIPRAAAFGDCLEAVRKLYMAEAK